MKIKLRQGGARMPVFQYQVKNQSGQGSSGQMEAASSREVAQKLREEGYFITAITAKGGSFAKTIGKSGRKPAPQSNLRDSGSFWENLSSPIKLKDLSLFTKQLAVLIRAGLNINNCLRILAEQTENMQLARVIRHIRNEIEGGESLHTTLLRRPKIFSGMYCHMVEAGEASGQLETVLERLNQQLERDFELKKKVSGAMIYPAVIACVAVAAVFVLMIVVIPTFTKIFTDAGMKLPALTQLLIDTSKIFQQFWYLVLLGLIGAVVGFKKYYDTTSGRMVVDKLMFGMIVIGPVIKKVVAARFTRTLATLLDSGVMVINAMEIVERAVGNTVVAGAINQARVSVTKGSGIAAPLAETKVLPLMVTQMIAVGEETGELSKMLNNVADFYEKEAAYAIEGLTTLIEPAVIVGMGLVVGVVVMAIYIPMFDLSSGATMK
jgi:type IV pilus assembly protein PilC